MRKRSTRSRCTDDDDADDDADDDDDDDDDHDDDDDDGDDADDRWVIKSSRTPFRRRTLR